MDKTQRQPMAKRLLSILFAITLVMGLVPLSAYAAIGEAANSSDTKTEEQNAAQGTEQDTAGNKATEEAEDSSASNAGTVETNEEEPAADSQDAAQNGNSASNNADPYALQTADNGISVAENGDGFVYPYNGSKSFTANDIYTILNKDEYYGVHAGYRLDGTDEFWPQSGEEEFTPKTGSYSAEYFKIEAKFWKSHWVSLSKNITFQKQWDTTFTSSNAAGGVTDTEGKSLSKLTSNADSTVNFKVKQIAVPGTEGSETVYYDTVVTRVDGDTTTTLSPDASGVYSFTADANTTVKVAYQIPKAKVSVVLDDAAGVDKATVGNEQLTESKKIEVEIGFGVDGAVTPKGNYAVTSVALTGGKYSNYELIKSFTDDGNRTATFTIPSDLVKDTDYTLTIKTEQCKLQVQEYPSAAVKGLTDADKIKQRVVSGVLDLDNSVPSDLSADDLKIEYFVGSIIGYEVWWDISESHAGRSFGDKGDEIIRITYAGNTQYSKLVSEVRIQIVDGRIATHIEANETVSVKYAPEADLKKAIEAAIAPKVYNDESSEEIADAQVEFDYSGFKREVGTQYVTVKYTGSDEYKNSELEIAVEIAKGDPEISIKSQSITYGEPISTPLVSANPEEAKPIYAIVGIDGTGSSYISIDFSSAVSIGDYSLQDFIITVMRTNEFSANELLGKLNVLEVALTPFVGSDRAEEICSSIRKALEAVEKIAPGAMNSKIVLGGTPSDAGVYAVAAVTVNPNYNTDVAVGYLTIAPATQNVELRFKNELPGFTMTVDQVKDFDFSAGLFQGDLDITEKGNVSSKFIGTDYAGNVYSSTEAPTEPGLYSQVVSNFGGNYFAKTISRQFMIARVETEMTISFDGTTNPEQSVVYTGSKVVPTYTVTSGGKELDPSSVEVFYIGKDHWYFNDAPTEAGTYEVYAIYPGTSYYGTASAKCTLTIKRQSIEEGTADYRGVKVSDIDGAVYDGQEHVLVPEVKDANNNDLVRMKDYLISYDTTDFTNSGKVTVTVTGINNYTGTVERTYLIDQQSINPEDGDPSYKGVKIDYPKSVVVYNGKEQKWAPTVTAKDGTPLVEGEKNDYTVSYSRDDGDENYCSPGEITVTIKGVQNYTGSVVRTYEIVPQSINPDDKDKGTYLGVTVSEPSDAVYDGDEHKWVPELADVEGNPLLPVEYTVTYERNGVETDDFTNAGEITVVIEGIGNYARTVERTYTIEKAAIQVSDSATKEYNGKEQMFYVQATDAKGLAEGEVLTLSDAQVKGTEPGVYTEVSDYTWSVVKADGKTDSTGNYTIDVSGTLTITAADSGAAAADSGSNAKAGKGTAPQTGDATAPFAAGAAIAAAAALVALFASRRFRRSARH